MTTWKACIMCVLVKLGRLRVEIHEGCVWDSQRRSRKNRRRRFFGHLSSVTSGSTLRFLLDAGGALEGRRSSKAGRKPINSRCIFNFHDHQESHGGLDDVDSKVRFMRLAWLQQTAAESSESTDLAGLRHTLVEGYESSPLGSAGHSFGGVGCTLNIGKGVFLQRWFQSCESTLYPFHYAPGKASISLADCILWLYETIR